MRFRIPLVDNPQFDAPLRNKYIAAFGDACYTAEGVGTFDCFYKTWQKACADAVKIGQVSGNAPYDTGYTCQPVANTGDYTLQVGPDVAQKITINFQNALRQTDLIDINNNPTAVSGPYRNLTEPANLAPGRDFWCDTVDGTNQRQRILDTNRKAHGGKLHSDLANFPYPCKVNKLPATCTEQLVLQAAPDPPSGDIATTAQVHHVVPATDKRGCGWGKNSNKNAAVISKKLNIFFTNNAPPAEEITILNNAASYAP
jgi:hypothetical protein